MSGEVYSHLYEIILAEGALDIYIESIYMKKNRPANKICVLCNKEDLDKFIKILLTETSTFGVRYSIYNRVKLKRRFEKIDTPYGAVNVKLGYYKGELIKATPEYKDCKLISDNEKIPLYKVFNEINYIIIEKLKLKLLT